MIMKKTTIYIIFAIILIGQNTLAQAVDKSTARRQMFLKQLLSMLDPEQPNRGKVTILDATWKDWLNRTGELPPKEIKGR